MLQPSPDDLEAAFRRIEDAHPITPSGNSQQSETIYNIIKGLPEASSYHRLLEQHPSLIALLADPSNGEFTLFLPVNAAWQKDPGLAERVSGAAGSGALLSMHISPHFFGEAYLRSLTNIPTVYEPATSNGPQTFPLRLAAEDGWIVGRSGRFVQPSIRAGNGIIHRVDEVMLPPAPLLEVLRARGGYSTLLRAVRLTGFDEELAAQRGRGRGGTLFAPSDQAFAALGPDALRFLTEDADGSKYLAALLRLHFCPARTFYTNFIWPKNNNGPRWTSTAADQERIYKGSMGQELPSALGGEGEGGAGAASLSVSITRYMCLISMAVNAAPVVEQDITGSDGVAQGINDVLLPGTTVGKGHQDVIPRIKAALQNFV
ncbi:fasciclin domain family protein [Cordyceps javanica]|uniref:Fasciclin domain family protein n=1 Tax=Cordyceps javanica TaxID=43265 RepID=A0A545VUL3_9HYPO|nr:fasciclin domain family protein [Cordyceps javanica]TQW05354.1 fasciclin domain family protein [Cordyceps javanica]